MTTAITTLTGWVKFVDFDKCSAVPVGFVGELANQFTPVRIADCFGQSFVLNHVFNAQTFTANHLVFVYQLGGQFVGKVAATISNFCLNSGYFLSGFMEIGRAFLFLGKSALGFRQFLFIRCGMARIARFKPVSGNNNVSQTQINAGCFFTNRQWFRLETAEHGHKVAACAVLGDVDGRWFTGKFAAPADIQWLFALGDVDFPIFISKSRLGELCALFAAFFLESRVFSPAIKEVFKCRLLVSQRLLKGDARNVIQPCKFREFLQFSQSCAGRIVINLLTFIVKGVSTPFQDRIIDNPHATKGLRKQFSLFSGWVKALFNGDFFHISQEYHCFCENTINLAVIFDATHQPLFLPAMNDGVSRGVTR